VVGSRTRQPLFLCSLVIRMLDLLESLEPFFELALEIWGAAIVRFAQELNSVLTKIV
jgi:hypothetical protein